MRIAVVDDDVEFTTFVKDALADVGHHFVTASNGTAFVKIARNETFDLILLDWNLPGVDGIEIVRILRTEMNSDVPILLLTLRTDAADIVAGLEAGADDFITKPVDPRVLVARIEAIRRRREAHKQPDSHQQLGDWHFDATLEQVTRGGITVQLTAKEFQLAQMLFRNLSRPLSRAYLLETVWNRSADIQTRTLDSHVARLRTKMGLRPQNGYRLSPIYSYGYRLEPVERSVEAGAGDE